MQKTRVVGFVFGGDSPESEVSVITMLQMKKFAEMSSWMQAKYFFWDKEGHDFWLIPNGKLAAEIFASGEHKKVSMRVEFGLFGDIFKASGIFRKKVCHVDAVVNCCHGGFGESGELAGLMKCLGIPFSTSNHTALGLSMDKHLFKCAVKTMGIKVPAWVHVTDRDFQTPEVWNSKLEKIKKIGDAWIVKPNDSGSSLGVTVARTEDEIENAVKVAFEFSKSVIIEKLIENKIEFNCGVVGRAGSVVVSEVDQIVSNSEMFSFEDKYIGERGVIEHKKNTTRVCGGAKKCAGMAAAKRLLPAPISDDLKTKIQSTATRVFEGLGLSGIARVDFLFDAESQKLFVGEINAVPGSMGIYFFAGSKFDELMLLKKLVDDAEKEQAECLKVKPEFVPKILKQ
ncbi:MAG: ATP-grasp domain-containing protein [Clostridia bacterium]|nr:ATP-grasp domain-containing protein [Clostridia bacterium]